MDTVIWVAQILVGLLFLAAGFMKLTQPKAKLQTNMKWVEDFSPNTIKGIGALELLGGVGVILPSLTNILPVLSPLAALGLVLVMVGAIITHIRRGETPVIVVNLVLLALAAFVAYGRFIAAPL